MEASLEIVVTDGEFCLDSRLLAAKLGYKHETVTRNITRHKARLERKGVFRQIVGKPLKGTPGGRPETYYMLDERQCLILTGSLKKGEEAEEWHDLLVDQFLLARQKLRRLEKQPQEPTNHHTLSDAMRARAMKNLASVPSGYFSVMGELFKHLYNLEALIQQKIDDQAMIEISVGQHWSTYAREQLRIPNTHRRQYQHVCPNGRIVLAWAYPLQYVTTFDIWLWETYFPQHFPAYRAYRATRIALQGQQRQRLLRSSS
jgi:phage regulator Rha-like protein